MRLNLPARQLRIMSQWLMFTLWAALIWSTQHPIDHWITRHIPVSLFLRIDPLVLTVVSGGLRMGVTILFLAFVTIVISLALGRVFCGWVCPLGAIFDAYGWVLRRLRVHFDGPSPAWFRFKYYLLGAILLFSLIGGVSPLMGLDPIVLLTRTAATVVGPFFRKSSELNWAAGSPLGNHGDLINGATLVLFLGIMSATTRLSRIWCRTVCPLGAYLAILSRNSVLKRTTEGCVHCNICSAHCPTGAIDFNNAEIYSESECIKCFDCSDLCPVDANQFKWVSPLKAFTPEFHPVQLERRKLLGTAAAVAVSAPALALSGGSPGSSKRLIRPPMSREEKDFLTSCIRCGECMKACPTGILKPAGLEHGLRALWSPVMVATEGPCAPGCNACSVACPTDAILKYPIEEKYSFKAGTAIFNSSLCISFSENKFCSECVKVCPTEAIVITEGWKPEPGEDGISRGADTPAPDGTTPERPSRIRFEACIGCGACEYACNQVVSGSPAMILTSYGRAIPKS